MHRPMPSAVTGRTSRRSSSPRMATGSFARNWRSPDLRVRGELDLVLREGPTLVFCEVKTRTSAAYGLPAEAISPAKRRKLRRLAMVWLRVNRGPFTEVRFDVIAVLAPRCGAASLEHLKGAF